MKKFLTSALAIVLFVGASQAQSATTENDQPHHLHKGWMKDLNLTDAQKTELKTLHESQKKEMDALKASGSVSDEQRKALHEKFRSQFDAILTPAQRDEMKKNRDEVRANGKFRDDKIGEAAGRTGFMTKEVNLSADQQAIMKSIHEDFRAKADAIRNNAALSNDQKREQMKALVGQMHEQTKALLTPEQQQKMKELRGKHKERSSSNT